MRRSTGSVEFGRRVFPTPRLKTLEKPATLEVVKQPKAAPRVSTAARAVRRRTPTPAARPSSQFRLTRKERAILADPDWVTEDEADVIYCMRREHEPTASLEQVAKELGLPLEN